MNKTNSCRLIFYPSSFRLSATGSCQSSRGLLAWTTALMARVDPPEAVTAATDSRAGTGSSKPIELSMAFDRSTRNGRDQNGPVGVPDTGLSCSCTGRTQPRLSPLTVI
jgi:hypothetical protein